MPGGFTDVSKGIMMARSDERLSQQPNESTNDYRKRLEVILRWFKEGVEFENEPAKPKSRSLTDHSKTLIKIGKDQICSSTPELESHVRNEFFGGDPNKDFFPNVPAHSAEEIVRGGYIRALELALALGPPAPPKPIVGYWIIANHKDAEGDVFEVFVAETTREVHVLMLTPKPSADFKPPGANHARTEKMWVVSTEKRIKSIEETYPSGYARNHVKTPGANGVDCLQVVGY